MKLNEENLRREYLDEEYSIADCSAKFGVTSKTIKRYMNQWNIPARSKNHRTKRRVQKLKSNPNIGKKTAEYFAKIKESGEIPEAELTRRKKIGKWSKDFERTEEHCKKISNAQMGNKYSLGREISEETRQKISHSSRVGIRKKIEKEGFHWGMTGKNHTPESRRKNRLAVIRYIERLRFDGQPLKPRIGRNEKEILDNLEKQFGYKILRQFAIAGYFVDGYIPELKLAFEIDESHHYKGQNLSDKDVRRQKEIENLLSCEFVRIKD